MEHELIDIRSLTDRVVKAFQELHGVELEQELANIRYEAGLIKAKGVVEELIKSCHRKQKEFEDLYDDTKREPYYTCDDGVTELECNDKGVKNVINNYYMIMLTDRVYRNVKYNVILDAPEVFDEKGRKRRWNDADEATSKAYIEEAYHIHNISKHSDALNMFFREVEYNPILDVIEALEWDGENRIEHLLHTWMKCEDTPYTREVSRLIFAGGIWRLYNPGCKFDDVPVFVGTKQGEGKSTFISWLALNDEYFGEVKTVDGSAAVEQLKGKWICEIAEMNAFNRVKEVEAVKAFVTRQNDEYRKPYDRNPSSNPRRCIFIGTTNTEQFLKDKTGNRRFYPVICRSNGYDLFDHEEECRTYIEQCWAEARERYKNRDKESFDNFARRDLVDEYIARQEASMEDDWKIGVIGKYLDTKYPHDLVCVREIVVEALSPDPEHPINNDPRLSREIGQIIAKYYPEWVKKQKSVRTEAYGVQKCWEKASDENEDNYDLLP